MLNLNESPVKGGEKNQQNKIYRMATLKWWEFYLAEKI